MRNFAHHKYTLVWSFGAMRHNWELVGANGAINFRVSVSDDSKWEPCAGLEFHHLQGDGAPNHVNCELTGGRCWHDGTSLYATESVWPAIQSYLKEGNHKSIFEILEGEYTLRFSPIDKAVDSMKQK